MAANPRLLEVWSREQWRAWLASNHASSSGVWLVFYKDHTGVQSVPYEAAIREALCFGWVDSLVHRLDRDRYARKFTPRRPTSKWSDINRRRWVELQAAGLLLGPGLAAAPTANTYPPRPKPITRVPADIAEGLKANRKAWRFFQTLAPSYRHHYVTWIHAAKRRETRAKRMREAIALLAAGKKLGLK